MAKIIISGGGTGGHVFPAIAIADAIKKQQPDAEILFVGAKGKLEMEKVPKAGYPIKGLWISGFHRKLTLRNLMFPFKLLSSLLKSWQVVGRFKPDVAVGVGGYASGPLLEVANRRGVPTLIQEQNSFPGVTNRLLGSRVQKVCVAYEGMERFFPQGKIQFTGNPVRTSVHQPDFDKAEACKHFGLSANKKTVFLFGGSLGARSLNEAVAANAEKFAEMQDVQILWQAGKLYIDEFGQSKAANLPNVHILDFVDRMDWAYGLADVIVCRAGALTISELCLVGKAAILIPSPNVAEDHQTKNAQALVDQEAAQLLTDRDAKTGIIPAVKALLDNGAEREKLETNIQKLARPNAAEEIATEVLKLINQ
ncbi:MAG: undecaprenyldiphospho-muramoylpentapeptide beta-N-acetylglucosaminyltransferase [Saprospiraceae bacterium]|nr:undecaprenyldiphospho-muramoylpentapeptide beta-N-acetylglucosaminyltransferase [Saprospiraceae bacterium]